jgi:hypothetical protein
VFLNQKSGMESVYDISNDNEIRVVNFAILKSMIVKSTIFPHNIIHKWIWTSLDGEMCNQFDRD